MTNCISMICISGKNITANYKIGIGCKFIGTINPELNETNKQANKNKNNVI